jgi:AraC-like DNA-binding protein
MFVPQSSVWSTGGVAQSERFDFWRESVKACFNPMSPRIEKREIGNFHGKIEAMQLGAARLLNVSASPHSTGRTPRDIENGTGEYIALYRERGETIFEFDSSKGGRRTSLHAGHGDMVISNSDKPYHIVCNPRVAIDKSILFFPKELFASIALNPDAMETRIIPPSRGAGALLSSYFDSFLANAMHLREAVSAYGQLTSNVDMGADGRTVQLAAIKSLIDKSLSMPRLDSRLVADKAGLSVRNLHRLFERSGTTLSQYIRDRRLELAKMLLRSPDRRHHNVSTIAFDCGFESLATFYRVFRHGCLCTPVEYRETGSSSASIQSGPALTAPRHRAHRMAHKP